MMLRALFVAQEERGFYSMILIHEDGTAEWGGSVGKPPTYAWPHKASLGFLNFGTIDEIRNGDEVVGPNSAVTIGDELTGIIPNHGFTLGKVVSPETAYEMLCKGAAKEDHFPAGAIFVAACGCNPDLASGWLYHLVDVSDGRAMCNTDRVESMYGTSNPIPEELQLAFEAAMTYRLNHGPVWRSLVSSLIELAPAKTEPAT